MENITDADVKKRYLEKIALCEGIDPYKMKENDMSVKYEDLPKVCYMDLFNYFVLSSSYYTKEQMCAFKSLEAYKYFASGFVKIMLVKKIANQKRVIIALVYHSMRLNLQPEKAWVLCAEDGKVIVGHCTCLAGLGEVCSHVAATLYSVESMVKCYSTQTKTDVLCTWNRPTRSSTTIIKNTQIRHMDFTIKERIAHTHSIGLQPFNSEEIFDFAKELKERTQRHSTLALVTKGLNEEFNSSPIEPSNSYQNMTSNAQPTIKERRKRPKIESSSPGVTYIDCDANTARVLRMCMQNIYYNAAYKDMNLDQLMSVSQKMTVYLTDEDIKFVEELTVEQSISWHWEKLRVGRVTGSNFKKVCVTNLAKPAKTTVMNICYPEKTRFTSKATQYGKDWENYAKEQFDKIMAKDHINFSSHQTGLLISKVCNFFAVSPDAVCKCSCCGKFIVEIKCPISLADVNSKIEDLLNLSDPYILLENNEYNLNVLHAYYYQMQMTMAIYVCDFGYLFVWSPKFHILVKVNFNKKFWDQNSVIALPTDS